MILWAIIPVKPLRLGKSRLSGILSVGERAQLTSRILSHTLQILRTQHLIFRTLVVSRDPAVLKVGRKYGASTYKETDRQGLNMALTRACHITAAQRAEAVLILPADLPLITAQDVEMMISAIAPSTQASANGGYTYPERSMAICTDHNRDGTNALTLCPPIGFTLQFGPNSFRRHLDEADRLAMTQRIVHAPGIKFDLDTEEDWNTYQSLLSEPVFVQDRVHT